MSSSGRFRFCGDSSVIMESGWEMLPVTLWAGVGRAAGPAAAAAAELAAAAAVDDAEEAIGSEEVAGENCEGLCGV